MTIQQTLDQALKLHQSGQLPKAEQLYRQILSQDPLNAGALHYLGVIAHQTGKHEIAQDLIRRAIAINPNWPEAFNNLSVTLRELDQFDEAISAARQAIALRPNYPEVLNNLGNALQAKGQLDNAIAAFRDAIVLRPNYADAHYNLANALRVRGDLDSAIASFHQAIVLNPNLAFAHNNLGNALVDKGLFEEAITEFRSAIQITPEFAEACTNLGNSLKMTGRLDEAIAAHQQAIHHKPDYASAFNNLGNALADKNQYDQAIAAYRQAISIEPGNVDALNNLGNVLADKGFPDQAIAAYRQAIALKPTYAQAFNNLGNALAEKGELDAALESFHKAVALQPDYARAHSNAVFTMLYHPDSDASSLAAELKRWNQQHADPLGHLIRPHSNDCNPTRRLRIGYVSSDFRGHVVGRNILPLFSHHNHQEFEIFCYSSVVRPDATTQQLKLNADHWIDAMGQNDDRLADRIRADAIDILVDLNLHTSGNRLLVFARKPAPIQVSFAGYPGSTGLDAIEYRLSDPYLEPSKTDNPARHEKTIRLPDSFWCYDALDCRDILVNTLPAEKAGFVTFGCLNNFVKINPRALSLWARVLREAKNSRLLLLAREGTHRQRTRKYLEDQGIDPARIEFSAFLPRREYLKLYHRIDIGLDTFPYNGHTTSLESLWMGVPVITLVGDRPVARAGWSQLSNLGMTDLAADTDDQFVKIAVDLANDIPRLSRLRASLRATMEQSPLMNAAKFARSIETAYRQIWKDWCNANPRYPGQAI